MREQQAPRCPRDPGKLVPPLGAPGLRDDLRVELVRHRVEQGVLVLDVAVQRLDVLLEHKYGWQKRLADRLNRKSRGTAAFAAIEIVDV